MDVDEEISSMKVEGSTAALLGEVNSEYYKFVLALKDNIHCLRDAESSYVHSPMEWHRAWKELVAQGEKGFDKVKAARTLIWLQTQSLSWAA